MTQETKSIVGGRLRSFRDRHGWSLRNLSERCGLSINAISRIERGENSPTISSLTKLSHALGVPITDFFIERSENDIIFTPEEHRPRLEESDGLFVEHLIKDGQTQQLDPFLLTIAPGSDTTTRPVNHPGEEFIHCLDGDLELRVGDQIHHLQQGDSLLFQGMLPHAWRNTGHQNAQILLVIQAARDNRLARQRHQTG